MAVWLSSLVNIPLVNEFITLDWYSSSTSIWSHKFIWPVYFFMNLEFKYCIYTLFKDVLMFYDPLSINKVFSLFIIYQLLIISFIYYHPLYIFESTNTLAVPSDEHVNTISNRGWNVANTTLSECLSIFYTIFWLYKSYKQAV